MKIPIFIKVISPIIILGLFLLTVFFALNYETITAQFYFIFLFMIIFVFLFGFAMGQRFVMPIKKLVERATSLAEGILTTRVYLKTEDEFEQLAEILNRIAMEMEKEKTIAQKAEDIASVTVRAKTQELEEIIANLEEKIKNRTAEFQKVINDSEVLRGLVKSREDEITKLRKEILDLRGAPKRKK